MRCPRSLSISRGLTRTPNVSTWERACSTRQNFLRVGLHSWRRSKNSKPRAVTSFSGASRSAATPAAAKPASTSSTSSDAACSVVARPMTLSMYNALTGPSLSGCVGTLS